MTIRTIRRDLPEIRARTRTALPCGCRGTRLDPDAVGCRDKVCLCGSFRRVRMFDDRVDHEVFAWKPAQEELR